jgi:rubrerythrin
MDMTLRKTRKGKSPLKRKANKSELAQLLEKRVPSDQPKVFHCPKCDYEWISRKENPKACPYCKRYLKR